MQPMVKVLHLSLYRRLCTALIVCQTGMAVQTSQGAGSSPRAHRQCAVLICARAPGHWWASLWLQSARPDIDIPNEVDHGFVDSHQVCCTHTTLLQLTQHEYLLVSLANNVYNVNIPLQVDTECDPKQFGRGHRSCAVHWWLQGWPWLVSLQRKTQVPAFSEQ